MLSFKTANKPKSHEDVSKDHDCCHVVKMPEAHKNSLNFNHERKSLRILFAIFATALLYATALLFT